MKESKRCELNLEFEKLFKPQISFNDINENTQLYIVAGLAKILTPNKYSAHSKEDMLRYLAIADRMTQNIPLHELARLIIEHEMADNSDKDIEK